MDEDGLALLKYGENYLYVERRELSRRLEDLRIECPPEVELLSGGMATARGALSQAGAALFTGYRGTERRQLERRDNTYLDRRTTRCVSLSIGERSIDPVTQLCDQFGPLESNTFAQRIVKLVEPGGGSPWVQWRKCGTAVGWRAGRLLRRQRGMLDYTHPSELSS